jgi:CRP-like cAMP-binding protein
VTIATAVRDSVVWHLPKEKALRAMRQDPQLARQLTAEVSRRLRSVLLDLYRTAMLSAVQRTVIFLLEQLPPARRPRAIAMPLPAAKAEIASKLGLTPAHFSRILRQLASAGLLTVQAATITINDVNKLRSMANASLPRRHWF